MDFQCPPTPNCVSSEATCAHQRIAPLPITGDPKHCWQALIHALSQMPAVQMHHQEANRIHAIATTRLCRFKDDLFFELRDGHIAVKSASRLGYSDLGANRRRLEGLRARYLNAIESAFDDKPASTDT